MAVVRGKAEVKRFLAQLPRELEEKVLRGAAKAAATVVAEEAKARVISAAVAGSIKVATSRQDGRLIAKVQSKGKGSYLAPWLEWGTDPHFISVAEDQREGRSIGRINKLHKAGSLVINGQFVGDTVFHPGARPHPFMRPALDTKEADAIAAAQSYINARITRTGIVGGAGPEDEGE
ncbi:HK97 gp10 family phage protein [Sphingomonas sp. R-74633]|uniref:HK97-gp10 family putative phage morphogenesis protein n=1 Tax=Sphingomonas sp. R-74633 TaxID=2751188 RepID=UPI0015D3D765|nr:HK97-gp10 family putative phage morphogenesis protein [Sphingomonas sp. R-74633]NYT43107.1 HK97 gp10 family phage protein [Sphingomonas sp. R-74633]